MQRYKSRGDLLGRMRQPISFVRITKELNKPTSAATSETIVYSCHASIDYYRGEEIEAGGTTIARSKTIFTVRYIALIEDETLILRYRGQDYDIESVDDLDGDRAFHQVTAIKRK